MKSSVGHPIYHDAELSVICRGKRPSNKNKHHVATSSDEALEVLSHLSIPEEIKNTPTIDIADSKNWGR